MLKLSSVGLVLSALTFPTLASAQDAAEVPPSVVTMTVQQAFDTGTAALNEKQWSKALSIFSDLEAKLIQGGKSARNLAIVRLRKGRALFSLRRTDESEVAILAALEKLPANDASLAEDRALGLSALGNIAERRFDYGLAEQQYKASIKINPDISTKLGSYIALLQILPFVDPQSSLTIADETLALLATVPKVDPNTSGFIRALRGRTLMNLGRLTEAKADYALAIKLLGGLKYGKVDIVDTTTRSDAAIVALLGGDEERARELLSYSGAAMQADQGFSIGKDMMPPECGGENGPRQEDVAVIELQIADNGSVNYARPIYYSGTPSAAVEFAKTVSGWSWNAEELKKVQPFFRNQTRLEMRCTQAFSRPSATKLILPEIEKWAISQGATGVSVKGGDAAMLVTYRTALAQLEKEAGSSSPRLLVPLLRLSWSSSIPPEEAKVHAERAWAIVKASSAPPIIQAFFGELAAYRARYLSGQFYDDEKGRYQQLVSQILAEPGVRNDARARSYLSLQLFDSLKQSAKARAGISILQPVATDAALLANDPMKIGALIRLANVEASGGRKEAARALFESTGLSESQCALADAKPQLRSENISFPMEAMRWGLAGWTVVEFDIASNGTTLNQRPLISFPAFVFSKPTVRQFKTARYEMTYRPQGGLGCGAQQERVRYLLPKM